jgi:hypothetical protein
MLWKYLAEIITPVILGDLFTLSDLKPQILEHLIPVDKAAVLLAEILLITKELKVSMYVVLYLENRLNIINFILDRAIDSKLPGGLVRAIPYCLCITHRKNRQWSIISMVLPQDGT